MIDPSRRRDALMRFLKTEFAEELLECYRAIHAFRELFREANNESATVAEATRINETFCKPRAAPGEGFGGPSAFRDITRDP